MVRELLAQSRVQVEGVYALSEWSAKVPSAARSSTGAFFEVSAADLGRISALTTPNQVLAVARIPGVDLQPERIAGDFALYLDGIQDPGNLGTILRIADWFAIPYVFCSRDCVDAFNPKVIQASMGAFLRVPCLEIGLAELLEKLPARPVLGAAMDGADLFTAQLPSPALIVIGNEGRGLSPEVEKWLTGRITIPGRGGAESLNAAVATGIICAFFRHRNR